MLHSTSLNMVPGIGHINIEGIAMSNPVGRPLVYPEITLTCKQCGTDFAMRGSHARGYEKKHGRPQPYCSRKCAYKSFGWEVTEGTPTFICEGCGKTAERQRHMKGGTRTGGWNYRPKHCSQTCFHQSLASDFEKKRTECGPIGNGFVNRDGYRVFKMGGGKAVKEHRYEMEKHLGRPLRGSENVHHVDGNRSNNQIDNLELWVKTQPCGQRVTDRVAAALELMHSYPEFLEKLGYRVCKIGG